MDILYSITILGRIFLNEQKKLNILFKFLLIKKKFDFYFILFKNFNIKFNFYKIILINWLI